MSLLRSIRILFMLSGFVGAVGFGQLEAQVHDGVLWLGVSVEKEVANNVGVSVKNQLRLDNNYQSFKTELTQVQLGLELMKNLDLNVGYRFSFKEKGNSHRIYSDLVYGRKLKGSRYSYQVRLRMLKEFGPVKIPERVIRPRIRFSYNIKKSDFKPFAGAELYYSYNNIEQEFSKYRLQAGLSYKLSKKVGLKTAYYYEGELNDGPRNKNHILNIGLKIDLD